MATAALHPRPPPSQTLDIANPLPQLLQTPTGLALLELQGTINLSGAAEGDGPAAGQPGGGAVAIGRLDFPDYHAAAADPAATAWMRRVYLYVGEHQRLMGEVRKLPKPLAVVRRRPAAGGGGEEAAAGGAGGDEDGGATAETLEVVELVKYKIVFSQRPEPVGTAIAA